MAHYYTNNKDLKSNKKELEIEFEKIKFKIFTDIGVFSKNSLDFGTEVMLKEFFRNNKRENIDILDIGCGYGIVSLIISKYLKNVSFLLTDVNDRAIDLARENLELHNVKNFEVRNSYCFDNIDEKFDVILSNPPIRAGKDVIFKIYEKAFLHLKEKGEFYCVIQTKHGAKSTEKKLKEIFENCITLNICSGYRVYFSKKED